MGAYQDIMGDMHNLFGRVNEVHVFLDEDEECGYYIEEVLAGSTIGQVLSLTQWETNELARRMKTQVDAAIKSDRLKPNEAMRLLDGYENESHCLHVFELRRSEEMSLRTPLYDKHVARPEAASWISPDGKCPSNIRASSTSIKRGAGAVWSFRHFPHGRVFRERAVCRGG